MSLAGRLALITGGGSGIGRATCLALASKGARLAVVDVDTEGAEETRQLVGPDSALAYEVDVSSRSSVSSLWLRVRNDFSDVPSIIVNSAGITRDGLMLSMDDSRFDEVIDINLKGTFLVTQIACQQLIQHGGGAVGVAGGPAGGGSIINISSISAKIGNYGQANYVASKAGVIGFTKTVAREMAKFNIRANTIVPGFIETPMTEVVPPKVQSSMKRQIPLGRFGRPKEIADVAVFLASHDSSYVTGSVIEVTGGLMM